MPDFASTDAELLSAWLERRDEPSFHALVSRHAGLVHSAARRKCDNDALAAEASQLTFILLARKAPSLAGRTSLAGWLHITAMRQTKDLIRQSRREQHKRDRLAMETGSDPDNAEPPCFASALTKPAT
jgi:DNA-directed RNA polymerase specialized sigma24 family protein